MRSGTSRSVSPISIAPRCLLLIAYHSKACVLHLYLGGQTPRGAAEAAGVQRPHAPASRGGAVQTSLRSHGRCLWTKAARDSDARAAHRSRFPTSPCALASVLSCFSINRACAAVAVRAQPARAGDEDSSRAAAGGERAGQNRSCASLERQQRFFCVCSFVHRRINRLVLWHIGGCCWPGNSSSRLHEQAARERLERRASLGVYARAVRSAHYLVLIE